MNTPTFIKHAPSINNNMVLALVTTAYNTITRLKKEGKLIVRNDEYSLSQQIDFGAFKHAQIRFYKNGRLVDVHFYHSFNDNAPQETAVVNIGENLW